MPQTKPQYPRVVKAFNEILNRIELAGGAQPVNRAGVNVSSRVVRNEIDPEFEVNYAPVADTFVTTPDGGVQVRVGTQRNLPRHFGTSEIDCLDLPSYFENVALQLAKIYFPEQYGDEYQELIDELYATVGNPPQDVEGEAFGSSEDSRRRWAETYNFIAQLPIAAFQDLYDRRLSIRDTAAEKSISQARAGGGARRAGRRGQAAFDYYMQCRREGNGAFQCTEKATGQPPTINPASQIAGRKKPVGEGIRRRGIDSVNFYESVGFSPEQIVSMASRGRPDFYPENPFQLSFTATNRTEEFEFGPDFIDGCVIPAEQWWMDAVPDTAYRPCPAYVEVCGNRVNITELALYRMAQQLFDGRQRRFPPSRAANPPRNLDLPREIRGEPTNSFWRRLENNPRLLGREWGEAWVDAAQQMQIPQCLPGALPPYTYECDITGPEPTWLGIAPEPEPPPQPPPPQPQPEPQPEQQQSEKRSAFPWLIVAAAITAYSINKS